MSKKAAPGKTGGSKKDGAVRNESSKSVEPPEDVEVHSSMILRHILVYITCYVYDSVLLSYFYRVNIQFFFSIFSLLRWVLKRLKTD